MRLNPPTRPFVEFILREVEGLRVTCSYLLLVQSHLPFVGSDGCNDRFSRNLVSMSEWEGISLLLQCYGMRLS